MIDWMMTREKLGDVDLDTYRPKVVVQCDMCKQNKRIMTIRIKSKIKNGQIQWECPKCVGNRNEIKIKLSQSTKEKWKNDQYREQITIESRNLRNNQQYVEMMKNIGKNGKICKNKDIDDTEYRLTMSNMSKSKWTNLEYRNKTIKASHDSLLDNRPIRKLVSKKLWQDNKYREKLAIARSKQPRISSCQKILYSILDNLGINYLSETVIGPYTFDCFMQPNILIECQGDYWHSLKKNIENDMSKLAYIRKFYSEKYEIKYLWEHEFKNTESIINIIKFWSGSKQYETINIDINKISIRESNPSECKLFMSKYHKFPYVWNGIYYGAFFDNKLIACCRLDNNELTHLCTHPQYDKKHIGSYLISKLNLEDVFHICDLSDQDIFINCGFKSIPIESNWYISDNGNGWATNKDTILKKADRENISKEQFITKYNYKLVSRNELKMVKN